MMAETPPDGRWAIWSAVPAYLSDYWLTGSGRGTFAAVFTQYQPLGYAGTVTHAENIVLHLAVEWGVMGALLALVSGVGGWLSALPRGEHAPRPIRWALLAGLAGVGLQQLVDFGFEAMGVSIPVAVAFGLILGGRRPRGDAPPGRVARAVPLAVGATLLLVVGFGAVGAARDTGDAAVLALQTMSGDAGEVESVAAAALSEHPADAFVALAAAQRLARMGRDELRRTLRWLNHAQRLFPNLGLAHLLTARVLDEAGYHTQAAGALRAAITKAPWDELRAVREAHGRFQRPDRLARAVPHTARAVGRLGELLLSRKKDQLARAVMDEILLFDPDHETAHRIRGRAYLALGDLAGANADADWLEIHGAPAIAYAFRARARLAGGDLLGARASLEEGERHGGGTDAGFLNAAARVYIELGEYAAGRRALDRLWVIVGSRPDAALAVLRLRARFETRAGDAEAALLAWTQADAMDPNPVHAMEAGRIEAQLGRTDSARSRLETAARRWPHHEGLKTVLSRLPAAAAPGTD
jgi:tetratricopeptide (TPR) repeat protein